MFFRFRNLGLGAVLGVAVMLTTAAAHAQFVGNAPTGTLQHLNQLKPPAGSKVALFVFEDLGCPACAHAHPIEQQLLAKYHIAYERKDFPIPAHVWTFDGAVDARYIQVHLSPELAEEFRSDVFRSQMQISGKQDIQQYFASWLMKHGKEVPFVTDPTGVLARAVKADYDLGLHINLRQTPTIIVVTATKQQVITGATDTGDPNQMWPVVETAIRQTDAERRGSR